MKSKESKFTKTLWTSKKQDYNTPRWLFDKLNKFYHFKTDPATTKDNPLNCELYFTQTENGLEHEWQGPVFINPPYNNITPWVEKSIEYFNITTSTVVLLLPARTGNFLWQSLIFPKASLICFIRGRLCFSGHDNSAPFDSALIVFGHTSRDEKDLYRELGQIVRCDCS
jgi:phage N-6-adenine-methyltransferase